MRLNFVEETILQKFPNSQEEEDHSHAILERYLDQAYEYSEKYNEVRRHPTITLYRVIKAEGFENIDLKKIGTHWSFEKSGAGSYGTMGQKGNDILLTGIANTKDIDWQYGFTSFMYYGEDQWECALFDNSPVTLTNIDDQPIKSIQTFATSTTSQRLYKTL